MLELKKIKKSYSAGENEQTVLKGIDVNFRRNEFTSILGSSGSGKTTLLNIIGGLDKYDSGDLIIDGISTKKYDDRDWDSYRNYRVGFIFQNYNLIMHQSVLANVEIALTLSGVSKTERKKRAIDALTKVGLKQHINKKPSQLSGGQMQRVAIARAIVNNPEIILADEPTGALDSKTSIQIMDLLKEIAKDKLVIMVTHNPDLAKEYSNRIIELKDGLIVNDSNPFDGKEKVKNEKKMRKTSMSLLTSLSLSFNNLLTKKGRTFLTAFAGSIGIIGIALILSLSNGVNNYAKSIEKDSLSDYPINIEKVNYDLFGSISMALKEAKNQKKCDKNHICSKDDIVKSSSSSSKGVARKNNTKEFKKYIDSNNSFKKYSNDIIYSYDLDLQVYTTDYLKVNPSDLNTSDEVSSVFKTMLNDEKKFELLAGSLPKRYDEIVLVVGEDNIISDSLLYALNIKDRKTLSEDMDKLKNDENYSVQSVSYSYNDLINKNYKLILNTDYYKEENGIFIDYSNDSEYMKNVIDNGLDIKIVGVVKEKDSSSSYVGYSSDLTKYVIDEISKTSIYGRQINNKTTNVITGQEFDGISNTYDAITKQLGVYDIDEPSVISIYPKNYESKDKIVKLIDKYNDEVKKSGKTDLVIKYSDMMKNLIGGISNVVNIISFVLIGFVAISLIVSSIMIGIITYISVLERTKEIGILRAIGASKRDIIRVFRAETIIEGAVAGLLGVFIAFVLCIQISMIVEALGKIPGIAKMPFGTALILVLLSTGLNVIAGTIPSKMAAKKDPVESLRSE
ncbi:MAG: ATP-binding cassette domain-containing protein [Bacilli bacterium]|nr:ATP-binding cassette domain-containing protein [Bacilli bacterium]